MIAPGIKMAHKQKALGAVRTWSSISLSLRARARPQAPDVRGGDSAAGESVSHRSSRGSGRRRNGGSDGLPETHERGVHPLLPHVLDLPRREVALQHCLQPLPVPCCYLLKMAHPSLGRSLPSS